MAACNENTVYHSYQSLPDEGWGKSDTLSITINLADSTGRWIGNGWGSIYQSAVFIKSVRPLYPANYTFKIMNGMKDEKLSGINDIGIRIERQEN